VVFSVVSRPAQPVIAQPLSHHDRSVSPAAGPTAAIAAARKAAAAGRDRKRNMGKPFIERQKHGERSEVRIVSRRTGHHTKSPVLRKSAPARRIAAKQPG